MTPRTVKSRIVAGPPIPFPKAAKWFDFRNAKDDSVDLFIYNVVGDSWEGSDALTVVKEIKSQKGKKINVHIDSPGGSVFDGYAIFNALRAHDATVETWIDGMAASIASIIALAGSKIHIATNAMMMIHNPLCFCYGNATEIRKQADVLDKIRDNLVDTYMEKTKKPKEDVIAAMDAETYFSAKQAKEWGLVDEVTGALKIAACVNPEIVAALGWQKTPKTLLAQSEPTPSPQVPRSILAKKLALYEMTTS